MHNMSQTSCYCLAVLQSQCAIPFKDWLRVLPPLSHNTRSPCLRLQEHQLKSGSDLSAACRLLNDSSSAKRLQ